MKKKGAGDECKANLTVRPRPRSPGAGEGRFFQASVRPGGGRTGPGGYVNQRMITILRVSLRPADVIR